MDIYLMSAISIICWSWAGYEYLAYCWRQNRQDRQIERLADALEKIEATVVTLTREMDANIYNLATRNREVRPAYGG